MRLFFTPFTAAAVMTFLMVATSYGQPKTVQAQPKLHAVTPSVHLPDGSVFMTWDVPLTFSKTYYVDGSAPGASDKNPGTKAKPFATISRAAEILEPGQRVVIASGVYRERVRPQRGGTGQARMISYESAENATVIISGSKPLESQWTPSRPGQNAEPIRAAWMVTLPAKAFADAGENPFAKENLSDDEINSHMPWALKTRGKAPNLLKRGLLFCDGQRLVQVPQYEDLADQAGAYWVAEDGLTVHARAPQDQNPNQRSWEFTVHGFVFAPEQYGLGYIRVKGLTIQHAGNRFPCPQAGAISTQRGHHWIIEDCTVRQVNAVGIDIGDQYYGKPLLAENGQHIVRRNRVEQCGIGGIQGKDIAHTLIEDNLIRDVGWHRAMKIYETGGMKFLLTNKCLVRRNLIIHSIQGPGIWLDVKNRYSRVTQNVVIDVDQCSNGGILIEASPVCNMVDTNLVWDVQGPGINNIESDDLIVANNFIAHTVQAAFSAGTLNQGRKIDGKLLTYDRGRVVNNILFNTIDREPAIFFREGKDNHANGNQFLHDSNGEAFDLQAWQNEGFGKDSTQGQATMELDIEKRTLRLQITAPTPTCTPVKYVTRSLQGEPILNPTLPGPFDKVFDKVQTISIDPRKGK